MGVFADRTTYNTYHDKKDPFRAGVPARDFKGWRLPHPRPSLGLEFVGHKLSFTDRMYT
jgi:hypothetical protein